MGVEPFLIASMVEEVVATDKTPQTAIDTKRIRGNPDMSGSRNFFSETIHILAPLLIVATGVGGFLVFGQRPEVPQREMPEDAAPLVETTKVETFDGVFTIEIEGVTVPYRQVTLSAEVAGRIVHKWPSTRSGNYVAAGAPLFLIDKTDYTLEAERYQSQLTQAEEEVRAVDVDISSTETLIALAQEELFLRQKDLSRRLKLFGRKAITDNEVDETRRLELSARTSFTSLENQLSAHRQRKTTLQAARDLVKVQLKRAEIDIERTQIHSPITGTVVVDYVEENDYVKKGDPIVRLNETSRMEVQCSLRLDTLYWVWLQAGLFEANVEVSLESRLEVPETPVSVVFEFDGAEYIWDGVLSRYEGTGLDAQTRTIPCRVLVKEPTRVRKGDFPAPNATISIPSLYSGMYVTIRIPVKPPITLLTVPSLAIRPGGQVWVIRDGMLQVVSVQVDRTVDETALIRQTETGGLRAGEKVITSPLAIIRSGMPVKELAR